MYMQIYSAGSGILYYLLSDCMQKDHTCAAFKFCQDIKPLFELSVWKKFGFYFQTCSEKVCFV